MNRKNKTTAAQHSTSIALGNYWSDTVKSYCSITQYWAWCLLQNLSTTELHQSAEDIIFVCSEVVASLPLLLEKRNSRPTSSSTWFLLKSYSWGGGNKCVVKRWGEGRELDQPVNYTRGNHCVGERELYGTWRLQGLLIYFCSVHHTEIKTHTRIQIKCAGKGNIEYKKSEFTAVIVCRRRICSMLNGLTHTEPLCST